MWHLGAGTLSAGISPKFPLCFTYLSPGCLPFALMSWQYDERQQARIIYSHQCVCEVRSGSELSAKAI